MIIRSQKIEDAIAPKRVLIVYGPRRIGKTTLTQQYFENLDPKQSLYAVGDDLRLQELFNSLDRDAILNWANFYQNIIIDEAQYISKIGSAVKMIIDAFPGKNIILTGSSSFELSQQAGEPLTGRHYTITLLPIMQQEINKSNFDLKNNLEQYLIYGLYPEIVLSTDAENKKRILSELIGSYFLKDILVLDKIKSSQTLIDILRALAFQIGNEVSYAEIARLVGRDIKTVQRYIDVLEKTFVIKKISAYSTNLRNEISKKNKFYFYDLGIRNAIINQFNDIIERNDVGGLWENFAFMELYKKSLAENKYENFYFWRTTNGQEIDIIIEKDGKLKAFECKYSQDKKVDFSIFLSNYPRAEVQTIHKENYLDFLLNKKPSHG